MFEHEVEMEKQQSSVVPLLLIVALILAIVGMAGYYLIENRKVLSQEDATKLATASLSAQGAATVSFHTGTLKASVNDNPQNPQYRLLEKIGYLTIGKMQGYKTPVALTAKGKELLDQLHATSSTESDGTELHVVPLATRELVGISKITMTSAGRATVAINWKWAPNVLGDIFDAGGPTLKALNNWDRMALIQKHGADFFHSEPIKVTLGMTKGKNGWELQTGE